MNEPKFQIGEYARVKSLAQLREEFDEWDGVFETPYSFVPEMYQYCENIYKVSNHWKGLNGCNVYKLSDDDREIPRWIFDECVLESVESVTENSIDSISIKYDDLF